MKRLNNRGSILQIVLVTFLTMVLTLTSCLCLIREKTNLYKHIDILMKQKNLEIFLVEYYAKEIEDGFLMSDFYKLNDYEIQSYVDVMGSFYEITTEIRSTSMNYQFVVQIDSEDYHVLKFEYLEG